MSEQTIAGPVTKTYIALKHTRSSAQVFVQVSKDKRVKIEEIPVDHAYSRITFMDAEGHNKTIRLKAGCDEIDQKLQINPATYNIPANEPFSQQERDMLKFRYGVLITDNPTVQLFLETSPQFDKFWDKGPDGKKRIGRCPSINRPMYTLYDEGVELQEDDDKFMKRLKAANKIAELKELSKAHELMIRLFGSFYTAPTDLRKCRSVLIDWLDDADDQMLDKLLKNETNADEDATILIGKALNLKVISFDLVQDQVVQVLPNRKTKNLREIPSAYTADERKQYFQQFLTSEDGKLLMKDLKAWVAKAEK